MLFLVNFIWKKKTNRTSIWLSTSTLRLVLFYIVHIAPWILFNKSPAKKPSQYIAYTGENRASNEIFFFLTQTQQSFRNSLQNSLPGNKNGLKWHK